MQAQFRNLAGFFDQLILSWKDLSAADIGTILRTYSTTRCLHTVPCGMFGVIFQNFATGGGFSGFIPTNKEQSPQTVNETLSMEFLLNIQCQAPLY